MHLIIHIFDLNLNYSFTISYLRSLASIRVNGKSKAIFITGQYMKKSIAIAICTISAINFVNCTPSDQQAQFGNGYKIGYNQRGNKISILDSVNDVLIADQVLKYAFDSTFIVALQKPFDSIPESGKNSNKDLSDCKEAFEKSTLRQYWIINKKQKSIFYEDSVKYSNVYGPFNEQEFLKKSMQLKVPKNLKLK